jgi:hypothetical protein
LDTSTSYQGAIQNGCNTWLRANHCDENPECGCHFEEGFEEPEDECIQEAQEPYQTEVTMEVTEDDDKPPILRQYQGCDADFPVVFIDHWNGRDPRYHNPPSWSGEIIWEFFDNLTVL